MSLPRHQRLPQRLSNLRNLTAPSRPISSWRRPPSRTNLQ
jgi:hypothetical protein